MRPVAAGDTSYFGCYIPYEGGGRKIRGYHADDTETRYEQRLGSARVYVDWRGDAWLYFRERRVR